MYLENIRIKNIGPIDEFSYDFKFDNNKPRPVVVIGKNGKGKTILTSYIGDFFVEIAKKTYGNVVENTGAYFRVVGGSNVKSRMQYGYSIINANFYSNNIIYCEKAGKIQLEPENLRFLNDSNKEKVLNTLSSTEENCKKVMNMDSQKNPLDENVMALFASYRSEKPNWMNQEAIKYDSDYLSSEKITGKLEKEIIINQSEEINEIWLERLIIDTMSPVFRFDGKYVTNKSVDVLKPNIDILENVESVLSKILRKNIKLILNTRNSTRRITINSESEVIPSIKHLSLGESILFNMFLTILRHGDEAFKGNISNLENIKGIVAIDEIDMHLDTEMQYDILPQLIKMFPGIQFIITSHSPLFLLGMHKTFGDNCDFIEMPTGEEVDIENFEEFLQAYNCLSKTNTYKEEMKKVINKYLKDNPSNDKALIITEGETDWMHMKNAYEWLLKKDKEFKKKYEKLEFEFFEYSSSEMGDECLVEMSRSYSKIYQKNTMIFIGDNDKEKIRKQLNDNDGIKNWGNNVFSFTIPVPQNRSLTPNICIEHYYSDSEIKTQKKLGDNIKRRLFIGNEFDSDGFSLDHKFYCQKKEKCGPNHIDILDGEQGERIRKLSGKDSDPTLRTNYALSKKMFAQLVQANKIKISNTSYDNFKLIFEKIFKIISDLK